MIAEAGRHKDRDLWFDREGLAAVAAMMRPSRAEPPVPAIAPAASAAGSPWP